MVVVRVVAQHPLPVGLPEHVGDQDLIRPTGGHEATIQDQDAVAVPGLVQVVGGQDDDPPGVPLVLHHREDPFLADQVEAGYRLVEEQDVSLACQRLGNQDPLALPE